MDARLFLIVFICIAALGLVLGIAIEAVRYAAQG